jgi:hypothetical protein
MYRMAVGRAKMQIFMPPSTIKSERRKKTRNRPPSLVYVELPNGNGGMLRDLSDEGFAVRAMMPLRAGGDTYFAFSLSETVRIEGEGEILWIGENGRVAGVRFTRVSSTARGQIQNWLGECGEFAEPEETAGKPDAPPTSTLQQLREEIRSLQMGGEFPRPIPEVPAESLQETVTAVPEVRASEGSVERAAPAADTVSHEDPVVLEITVPVEHVEPTDGKDSPETTPLPGMTLPGLQAALRTGKKLAHTPETLSGSAAIPDLPSLSGTETVAPTESAPSDLPLTAFRDRVKARGPEIRPEDRARAFPPRGTPNQRDAVIPPPSIPVKTNLAYSPPRLTPIDGKTRVDPPPAALASTRNDSASAKPQDQFPPLEFAENEVKAAQPFPLLPDISHVLIQPPGKQTAYSRNSTGLEPLPSLERLREMHSASWTERFTVSSAVKIMLFLTFAAAISAFHRGIGQSLIWVGEEMGGTHVSELQPPVPDDGVATGASAAAPTKPSNSGPQEAAADPPRQGQGVASDPAAPGENSPTSPSAAAENFLPPVTPLSGLTAPSASSGGQEPGQAEYGQALELLRGKSSEASQPEVVRLLWISVEKGNLSAELALAEMYWYGQGVARNCDQARILLSAAVRKGSAEARRRLQQFQREGCE